METYTINNIIGFEYPKEYKKIVELGLVNFDLWFLMWSELATGYYNEIMKEQYPDRKLIPFAKREDKDDVACFEIGNDKIQIIHAFSLPGYEQRKEYDDLWSWLQSAVNEMIEYNRDDEV